MSEKIKVLFVCMGNICRSPTAEAVFTELVKTQNLSDKFVIDSAGTHAYHLGEPADYRAQETAKNHAVDLSNLRARKVIFADFEDYDYLLAMDADNYAILMRACVPKYQDKIHYWLDYAPELGIKEVPDPYYNDGFEVVFAMITAAATGFLEHLSSTGKI